MGKQFKLAALTWLALLSAGAAHADWSADQTATGARDHPRIVDQFGGAMPAGELTNYVTTLGLGLVEHTQNADEPWTFTVLDSAQVNAFALPGGYVYVTRGLLALARSEAQLAAVLAHEITHVTENHVEKRADANSDALIDGAVGALIGGIFGGKSIDEAIRDGVVDAVGQVGAYSREQEFEADAGGIMLLELQGYNTLAQAEFLQLMDANAALKARNAGREFNRDSVPFFANHPAPAERLERATALAGRGAGDGAVAAYLTQIDGLQFGDSAQQGFVRGGWFIHPVLGFTFEAPAGMRVQNSASQISISGPRGSTLILSGGRLGEYSLQDYLVEWINQIPRRDRVGNRISGLQTAEINGLPVATATLRTKVRARRGELQMTVIQFNDRLVRFAGFSRDRDDRAAQSLEQAVRSFRALTPEEIADFSEAFIQVHEVTSADTIQSLTAGFPRADTAIGWFNVLNGLKTGEFPEIGSYVKLITLEPPG